MSIAKTKEQVAAGSFDPYDAESYQQIVALADSHTKLLNAARDMVAVLATPLDDNISTSLSKLAAHDVRQRLIAAIHEAERQ